MRNYRFANAEQQAVQVLARLGTRKLGVLAHTLFDNEFYLDHLYSMSDDFYSLFEQYTSPGPLDELDDDEFRAIAEAAFDHLAERLENALTITEV